MLFGSQQTKDCLQATSQFISVRIDREPVLKEIAQEIDEIATCLNTGKLNVDIFSQSPILAQRLHKFFSTHQKLSQLYQFKIYNFLTDSHLQQLQLPPAIILQSNSVIGQQQTRYELSANQNIFIGRELQYLEQDYRSQNSILIPLPKYRKVSGIHTQIELIVNSNSTSPTWQICDLNSRNGTYVNGQKLHGCKILQPGDRITLAYPSANEKCPEFVFECKSDTAANINEFEPLFDCDIACLVINSKQMLTDEEKQFIDKVSQADILKLIIVGDTSEVDSPTNQQINIKLVDVSNWLKTNFSHLSFELFNLPLSAFYPNASNTLVDPTIEHKFEQFCESLISISKNEE